LAQLRLPEPHLSKSAVKDFSDEENLLKCLII